MHFPRLVIPLATVLTAAFNLAVNLLAVFVFLLAYGIQPRASWLLLPLVLIALLAFTVGVGSALSALYVRYRDVQPIWLVASTLLFYGSPVLYTIESVPEDVARRVPRQPTRRPARDRQGAGDRPSAPTLARPRAVRSHGSRRSLLLGVDLRCRPLALQPRGAAGRRGALAAAPHEAVEAGMPSRRACGRVSQASSAASRSWLRVASVRSLLATSSSTRAASRSARSASTLPRNARPGGGAGAVSLVRARQRLEPFPHRARRGAPKPRAPAPTPVPGPREHPVALDRRRAGGGSSARALDRPDRDRTVLLARPAANGLVLSATGTHPSRGPRSGSSRGPRPGTARRGSWSGRIGAAPRRLGRRGCGRRSPLRRARSAPSPRAAPNGSPSGLRRRSSGRRPAPGVPSAPRSRCSVHCDAGRGRPPRRARASGSSGERRAPLMPRKCSGRASRSSSTVSGSGSDQSSFVNGQPKSPGAASTNIQTLGGRQGELGVLERIAPALGHTTSRRHRDVGPADRRGAWPRSRSRTPHRSAAGSSRGARPRPRGRSGERERDADPDPSVSEQVVHQPRLGEPAALRVADRVDDDALAHPAGDVCPRRLRAPGRLNPSSCLVIARQMRSI